MVTGLYALMFTVWWLFIRKRVRFARRFGQPIPYPFAKGVDVDWPVPAAGHGSAVGSPTSPVFSPP